jgi:hypothetical protein
MSGELASFVLRLPEVSLGSRKRKKRTLGPLESGDCRSLLAERFRDATDLWQFEARSRLPEATAETDRLTFVNWSNALLLSPDAQDWQAVAGAFGPSIPALRRIAPQADLLGDWRSLQENAVEAFLLLTDKFNVEPTLASRLLYQKRPGVFPLLDGSYRKALNVRPPQPSREEMFRRILSQTVAIAGEPQNAMMLDRVLIWAARHPSSTRGLALTRVRLFNLLAGAIVEIHDERESPSNPAREEDEDDEED